MSFKRKRRVMLMKLFEFYRLTRCSCLPRESKLAMTSSSPAAICRKPPLGVGEVYSCWISACGSEPSLSPGATPRLGAEHGVRPHL